MYPYDNRSPFERYCRQKGTRIDAIMTRLERGEDERELADRYHTGVETIRVYRKALEGKLSRGRLGMPHEDNAMAKLAKALKAEERKKERERTKKANDPSWISRREWRIMERLAWGMMQEGKNSVVIAHELGLTEKQTTNLMQRARTRRRQEHD